MSVLNSIPTENDGFLENLEVPGNIKFQKIGIYSFAGVMEKVTFSLPFQELAERWNFDKLLERHDFDLDDERQPGQRDITESHVKKIGVSIQHSARPYLGNITVALAHEHVDIKKLKQLGENIWLVQITVYETAPNPVVEDGQHRCAMAAGIWPAIKDATEGDAALARSYLEKTSVEMTLLLEDDPGTLSTIFVQMASTKPISPSLIAVMDVSAKQNQLGRYVTRRAALLKDRTGYLSTKASRDMAKRKGRSFDDLYPAAAVRSMSASMAGVGVRDRTPDQRESLLTSIVEERAKVDQVSEDVALERIGQEIVAILDYAYKTIPGWRELNNKTLTVQDFKRRYVHSSAAGLHVIANVIAAGRSQGLSPYKVVDALAKLPWRRDALRDAKDRDGNKIRIHEFFEDTLVKTDFDTRLGEWRAGTGGATRSSYEPAIKKVLQHIAGQGAPLAALGELQASVAIGLVAQNRGPGRPRKTAA